MWCIGFIIMLKWENVQYWLVDVILKITVDLILTLPIMQCKKIKDCEWMKNL